MSLNLLDAVKGHLTDSVIGAIGGALGESTERTSSAIGSVVPAILGGLMKKASTTQGSNALFEMIKDNDGSVLDDLGGLFNASNLQQTLNTGSKSIGNIFGSGGLQSIIDSITRSTGLGGKSLSSLFSMLAPVVLGVLGRQRRRGGLDAAGIAKLLMGQGSHLKKALPAALFSSLGLGSFDTNRNDDRPSRTVDRTVTTQQSSSGLRWLLPLALLALLAIVAWPYLKNMGQRAGEAAGDAASAAVDAAGDAAGAVGDAAGAAVDAAGDAVEAVGDAAGAAVDATGEAIGDAANWVASMFDYENGPTYSDLNLPDGSTLANFVTFLRTGTDASRTFTLEQVKFESGSAVLTADSRAQLDNVVRIMNAYDQIKVELQGHTDNTGNTDTNVGLSGARANSVRQYLIDQGIDADRLTAVGYGSAQPVASNDTPEGRRKNRRTDVRVTQK